MKTFDDHRVLTTHLRYSNDFPTSDDGRVVIGWLFRGLVFKRGNPSCTATRLVFHLFSAARNVGKGEPEDYGGRKSLM